MGYPQGEGCGNPVSQAAVGYPGEAGLATPPSSSHPQIQVASPQPGSPTLLWAAPGALTHVLLPRLMAPFPGVILEALVRDPGVLPTSCVPPQQPPTPGDTPRAVNSLARGSAPKAGRREDEEAGRNKRREEGTRGGCRPSGYFSCPTLGSPDPTSQAKAEPRLRPYPLCWLPRTSAPSPRHCDIQASPAGPSPEESPLLPHEGQGGQWPQASASREGFQATCVPGT